MEVGTGRKMASSRKSTGSELTKARNRFNNVIRQMRERYDEKCIGKFALCDCDRCVGQDDEDEEDDAVDDKIGQAFKKFKADSKQKTDPPMMIRLYERSVDLSQFSEGTPLYPVARDWVKNGRQTHQEMNEPQKNRFLVPCEETGNRNEIFVYELPPPKVVPPPRYDVYGNRIPRNQALPCRLGKDPRKVSACLAKYTRQEELPSPAVLFQDHVDHWNKVRDHWKNVAAENESRYEDTATILREMHKKIPMLS